MTTSPPDRHRYLCAAPGVAQFIVWAIDVIEAHNVAYEMTGLRLSPLYFTRYCTTDKMSA